MAITRVQSAKNSAAATTVSVTWGTPTTTGNFLVAIASSGLAGGGGGGAKFFFGADGGAIGGVAGSVPGAAIGYSVSGGIEDFLHGLTKKSISARLTQSPGLLPSLIKNSPKVIKGALHSEAQKVNR